MVPCYFMFLTATLGFGREVFFHGFYFIRCVLSVEVFTMLRGGQIVGELRIVAQKLGFQYR